MDEANEPCYQLPVRVLVGEVAAKINRVFVGAVTPDSHVQELGRRANADDSPQALQATYELGFTNNAAAIPLLIALTNHKAETFRAAALAGLGTLGARGEMSRLAQVHEHGETTSDRYMALKAIGDLGTPEALAYLQQAAQAAAPDAQSDLQELAGLYLTARPRASPSTPPVARPVAVPATHTAAAAPSGQASGAAAPASQAPAAPSEAPPASVAPPASAAPPASEEAPALPAAAPAGADQTSI